MTNRVTNFDFEDCPFVTMIHQALQAATTVEIADVLGVSVTTVQRWRDGMNLPHQALREPVHHILITREWIDG